MKYFVAAGIAFFAAVAALWWTSMHPHEAHKEWKRFAMEPETKVRPAGFEELKFQPADLRAPASKAK